MMLPSMSQTQLSLMEEQLVKLATSGTHPTSESVKHAVGIGVTFTTVVAVSLQPLLSATMWVTV